jgi:hypothetical protein
MVTQDMNPFFIQVKTFMMVNGVWRGKTVALVNIQVNSKLLQLATSVEKDVSKVVNEALYLWLKKQIIICPVTNGFCININGPCNECDIARNAKSHSI